MMDIELIKKIQKLSIIAMVKDDDLIDRLVLKGGNAIDLFYKISKRASIDIDFSINNEFKKDEIENIIERIIKIGSGLLLT